MEQDPIVVTYKLSLPSGDTCTYELKFEPERFELLHDEGDLPEWTRMDYQQCVHCPLRAEDVPVCPLARGISALVDFSAELPSYHAMSVEVVTAERTYQMETTAQRALSSIMGLIIPASGCPYTECLRPLARFHVPNASQEETLARVISFYMLSLHLVGRKDEVQKPADFEKLKRIYDDLHTINRHMADRLKNVCGKDSTLNAIVILDTFTMFLPMEIDDSLRQIKSLLEPMMIKLDALPEDET